MGKISLKIMALLVGALITWPLLITQANGTTGGWRAQQAQKAEEFKIETPPVPGVPYGGEVKPSQELPPEIKEIDEKIRKDAEVLIKATQPSTPLPGQIKGSEGEGTPGPEQIGQGPGGPERSGGGMVSHGLQSPGPGTSAQVQQSQGLVGPGQGSGLPGSGKVTREGGGGSGSEKAAQGMGMSAKIPGKDSKQEKVPGTEGTMETSGSRWTGLIFRGLLVVMGMVFLGFFIKRFVIK